MAHFEGIDNTRAPKGIRWDEPANLTIPDAPAEIALWEYCLEMSCEDGNYRRAAGLLDILDTSVAAACCNQKRGGQWPVSMLPGGVNYTEVANAKAREKDRLKREQAAKEPPAPAPPKKRGRPKGSVNKAKEPAANANDRTDDHALILPRKEVYKYMEDPVVWCDEKHPFIESKKRGQIPFKPWLFQKEIMRAVMAGGVHLYMKSRQVAVTTPLMIAYAHAMLYQYKVYGKPFHGHVFANKEDKALFCVKKARLAIWTADTSDLTAEEKKGLKGVDPHTNVKKTYYLEPGADNHILCHTTTGVDIRGEDVNNVVIDEADFIRELDKVWASCVEAVEIGDHAALVSSINTDEPATEFRRMCGTADAHGWHHHKIDWRANEERMGDDDGDTWEREHRKLMGDALFDVAHCLKVKLAGSGVFNVETVRRFAKKAQYVGAEPMKGHRYCKGLDIGGQGANDPCVFTVIDMTRRPGQLIYQRDFKDPPVKPFQGEAPLEALRREIEEEDAAWDGVTFADVTHNKSFVGLLKLKSKIGVKFSGGSGADAKRYDPGSGMRVWTKARSNMQSEFATALDTGELIVFEDQTPGLWKALETARTPGIKKQGPDAGVKAQAASKVKRMGENADHLDSAMLARLGMGKVRGMGRRMTKDEDEDAEGEYEVEEEQRRGGRELQMASPADKVAGAGGGRRWRQGEKF